LPFLFVGRRLPGTKADEIYTLRRLSFTFPRVTLVNGPGYLSIGFQPPTTIGRTSRLRSLSLHLPDSCIASPGTAEYDWA
jgi:hypothetical protein